MTWFEGLPATHIYCPAKAPASFKRLLGCVGNDADLKSRQQEGLKEYGVGHGPKERQ
jgi:hypothetical protein